MRKVLVVEDDRCLQTPIERLIKQIDPKLKVEWMTTGDEFREALANGTLKLDDTYALIISDINLPGSTSGLDLWDYGGSHFPWLPVLLISGMAVDEFIAVTRRANIQASYLPKPFRMHECAQVVQAALRRAYSPRVDATALKAA